MGEIHIPPVDVSALFVPDGEMLVPTEFSVGPWRSDAVHGSAVAALFAAALDEPETTVARITMDLLGTVPVQPLRLSVTDVRGGRRVRRRIAQLHHGDRTVAQGTAVLMADSDGFELPRRDEVPEPPQAPPAELVLLSSSRAGWPGFESLSMALHTTRGAERTTMLGWFQLLHPAIAGQPLTGLQMALAAADFTSGGTARILPMEKWTFASTDLTVNLARRPSGKWIGLVAQSTLGGARVAIASGRLHDADGDVGRCTQTQYIDALRAQG